MSEPRPKLEQRIGWVLLALLLGGCLLVVMPFLSAMLWAGVLSFSVWPVYCRLLKLFRGQRTLAALTMTVGMICIVLLPFVVIGATLAENVQELTTATRRWLDAGPPPPPAWLGKVPAVGPSAVKTWQDLSADSARLLETAKQLVEPVGSAVLKGGLKLGGGLLELALSIFITFFLLRHGVAVAERLTTSIGRVAGTRGQHLLLVAGNTVRGVVYGILGTALVQAVMAGIGFVIAGVPGASVLALLTFFLSVVPVGPPLVWAPAAFWLFHQGYTGWGIFMIIWGIGVSSVDNVVKPWLISQGSAMPFLLIFFGVLGGALAFGFIGVFLGPTLLAVGYRVLEEWGGAEPRGSTGQLDTPGSGPAS